MIFLLPILLFLCSSFTLADRLFEAKKGDYIVTEQEKNRSLLLIREMGKTILFEEVTVPSHAVSKETDWPSWMEEGAPGHSAWVQFEIDAKSLELLECYSFSKRGWLYLEDSELFLAKLLSLNLTLIPQEERKKIGPSPKEGEPDRRPCWNPTLLEAGKKTKISTEAWKAFWPKDSTLLASCQITLYFPPKQLSAFPLWIEASNGHFSYAIRTVAIGRELTSPIKTQMPRRPPKIVGRAKQTASHVKIALKSPAYYKSFSLYAFDLLQPEKRIGPIAHTLTREEKELYCLEISTHELEKHLTPNHRYKWVLLPEEKEGYYTESEDLFLWTNLLEKEL